MICTFLRAQDVGSFRVAVGQVTLCSSSSSSHPSGIRRLPGGKPSDSVAPSQLATLRRQDLLASEASCRLGSRARLSVTGQRGQSSLLKHGNNARHARSCPEWWPKAKDGIWA